jgi:SAM-dependent methyltransferase
MLYHRESSKYTGFSFMHGYELCGRWINLPEVIKTGKPVRRERKGEDARNFIASMAGSARKNGAQIAADCLEGLGEAPLVLDAGGGPLAHAREFARLGGRVTVLDLPEVVEISGPLLQEGEKISMVPGNMTEGLPGGPFDLVYLGNVCHIFDGDTNKKIFGMAHKVLRPGGRIAIQDFIRGVSPGGALFAVNMLVNTPSGGVWTMEQYSRWLTGAGFSNIELKSMGERHLIKAVKK